MKGVVLTAGCAMVLKVDVQFGYLPSGMAQRPPKFQAHAPVEQTAVISAPGADADGENLAIVEVARREAVGHLGWVIATVLETQPVATGPMVPLSLWEESLAGERTVWVRRHTDGISEVRFREDELLVLMTFRPHLQRAQALDVVAGVQVLKDA